MNPNFFSLLDAAKFCPLSLQAPDAWCGHIPFAAWLIKTISPNIFVELGTHTGNSYFSFCQAVQEEKLSTKCYAVDTWEGDFHAGSYGEEIFEYVNGHHQIHYSAFSRLLRMRFDDAVQYFSDGSIGLLHIDGLHTYEAVKHDFETWLPKLAPGAIVLLHDTNVRGNDFGVWKLWEELQTVYPSSFEFLHSNGLGVLQLNTWAPTKQLEWLNPNSSDQKLLKDYFSALGTQHVERLALSQSKASSDYVNDRLVEKSLQVAELEQAIAKQESQLETHQQAILDRESRMRFLTKKLEEQTEHITNIGKTIVKLETEIAAYHTAAINHTEIIRQMHDSHSWLVTKPFRAISKILRGTASIFSRLTIVNLLRLWRLLKPHLYVVLTNPRRLQTKLFFFSLAWRQAGIRGVLARLEESKNLTARTIQHENPHATSLMQYVAESADRLTFCPVQHQHKVSVIVPVYRGIDETTRCIYSVLNSTNASDYDLIIINDASPEAEIGTFLQSLTDNYPHIKILTNRENLGFVGTVNKGMKLNTDADIVLLNSDTIVANDWLDRLVAQAYSATTIGTVTPFSNNATICNYPDLDGWKTIPNSETVENLDSAFSSANSGGRIDIPTAVGFCMYIKRRCLQEVGYFDETAFGKGYGEENDFCLRASNKGWRHILAADIFVFHEGEISFSESAAAKKAHAMGVIRKRYPDYERIIKSHIMLNLSYPYRVAATASRYRTGEQPVVLFITHRFGGGTEKHVHDLANAVSSRGIRVLFLRPANGQHGCDLTLESYVKDDRLKVDLSSKNLLLLSKFLMAFGLTKVHVHHTIEFSFSIEDLLKLIGIEYDITIHDYYSICPRINLVIPGKGSCNTPTIDECNACIAMEPSPSCRAEITWWRAQFSSLLNGANKVYCPSNDTARRLREHFPSAPIMVVPHEIILTPPARVIKTTRKFRRFAILGVLAEHKGLSLLEEMLSIVDKNHTLIEFVLIGYAERAISKSQHLTQLGAYQQSDLPALIEKVDPDAILFLARCPETYSYTLSTAILSGRPLVVSDIGALPERVGLMSNSFIFPHNYSGCELVHYLMSLPLGGNEVNSSDDIDDK